MDGFLGNLVCKDFYPRPPRGGRPCTSSLVFRQQIFLSTPSARRATALLQQFFRCSPQISIHALREEGDKQHAGGKRRGYISIHALREEGDSAATSPANPRKKFLSTPSARRATPLIRWQIPTQAYFYPRPPRGGRRCDTGLVPTCCYFYPRPPRGGRHR